jgi:hypothetical protein
VLIVQYIYAREVHLHMYKIQLYLQGKAATARQSCLHPEVQLHLLYEVYLHLQRTATIQGASRHTRQTTLTRYSYINEVQVHRWGTAASTQEELHPRVHIRSSCTYKVQLQLWGTVAPSRYAVSTWYNCTYEVQLHLQGTVTPSRYSKTYEVQLYLWSTTKPTRTATPTRNSHTWIRKAGIDDYHNLGKCSKLSKVIVLSNEK